MGNRMDNDQAKRQWNSAAPGWARWEPVIGTWVKQSTEAMLDAAAVRQGARVLDVACGAGDQSIAAARRVGSHGVVLATDISEEMVGYVARQARTAGMPMLETRCCAAEELPSDGDPFDSAICRLGLMLFPDPAAALSSILRALRPGGRFAAIVVGAPEANGFLAVPLQILRRHANKQPAPGGPGIFALSDAKRLASLLEGAGFDDVSVRTIEEPLRLASAEDGLRMIQEGFGVYRATIGDQPAETQGAAWAEVLQFLKGLEGADGLRVPGQLHVAGGRKPREAAISG